jgi:hypothetical protein
VISPMTQGLAIICLAGPVGGAWRGRWGKLSTAQHEMSHALGGWIFGMHLGEISIEPLNDARGYIQMSFSPVTADVQPTDFRRATDRNLSDVRKAALLVSAEAPGWRATLRVLRVLRRQAAQMVEAHFDVIDAAAGELLDRGRIQRGEAVPLLEYLEAELNIEALAGLETSDAETVRNLAVSTLARVRAGAAQLAADAGIGKSQRALWARITAAADVESERRNCTAHVSLLGANQAAAVERFIATYSLQAFAIAA